LVVLRNNCSVIDWNILMKSKLTRRLSLLREFRIAAIPWTRHTTYDVRRTTYDEIDSVDLIRPAPMDASDAYDNFFTHTYDVPMGRCSDRYVVCMRKTCIVYTMRELLNSHRLQRDNYSTSTQCTCSTYIKHAWRRRMSYTDPWNGSLRLICIFR